MLVDQPLVSQNHLESLVNTARLSQVDIVATSYDGVLGVPAVFSASMWSEIEQLRGDRGCQKIILNHSCKEIIESDSPLFDVDTIQDRLQLESF